MKRPLPLIVIVLTVVLVAAGSVRRESVKNDTPDGAVQALFDHAKARDWQGAFQYVVNASEVTEPAFEGDLAGRDGSLRTYSNLERVDTSLLHQNANEAMVRTALTYSSALGPLQDTRDLKTVREDSGWKVLWPVHKATKAPPQVIPVTYLRWDVITRGANDDWGAQNVDPPRVRITSMNAVQRDGATILMGEIVNEDTVPGFVTVSATLVGKDGKPMADETSFDKMSHTLLPKEISPFRIDFPGVMLSNVKSVRMQPNAMLVSASADPVIGVLHQRLETNSLGRKVLSGDLMNESGEVVNIPHVLATYYDNAGRVIWVSDDYVDKALLPASQEPFEVGLQADIAAQVQSFRVTVNHYSIDKAGI